MTTPTEPSAPDLVLAGVGAALDAVLAGLDRQQGRLNVHVCIPMGPGACATLDAWAPATRHRLLGVEVDPAASPARRLAALLGNCKERAVCLSEDVVPAPGAVDRLLGALEGVATATPWGNEGELAGFPRMGESQPPDPDLDALSQRLAGSCERPELPMCGAHAVALDLPAVRACGGVDTESWSSTWAALADLSLRLSAMGHRHRLADDAYLACHVAPAPALHEVQALNVRYPHHGPMLAGWLMRDPLRTLRTALQARGPAVPERLQGELFQ
ncbi:MAG: hypothetical protein ACXIUZ_06365 [Lysobacteraceae bacterium]